MADKRAISAKEAKLKARKRDNQFKFIAIGAVAVIILIAMILNFFNIDLINVSGDKETFTSIGANGTFPYDLDTASKLSVLSSTKDNLLYLDDNNLNFINPSNGENVKTVNHFYSNPVIDVNGKYVLTYDQSRYKLRIDSSTNVIYDSKIEQNIITACIGENGNYAVATTSKKALSQATVYSRNLKKMFTWYSTDSYIIDMAISDNGKHTSIATINTSGTVVNSTIYIFENKTGKELSKFTYNDSTVADLQYAGDSLFVISDDMINLIQNSKDETNLIKQNNSAVICYYLSSNNEFRVVTGDFFNSTNTVLKVYDKKGKLKKEIKLNGTVKGVAGSTSATCVLFSDRVEYYNSSYELKNTLKTKENINSIEYFSSHIYEQSNLQITKNRLKAN